MPFTYDDCIKKGLLTPIPPSSDKAKLSIQLAEKWHKEAGQTLKGKAHSSCIIASYLVMFHAARAILFRDGFRERSHACVARYLEKFVQSGALEQDWVDFLDNMREMRHNDQYALGFFSTPEEAQKALENSTQFLSRMKKLLEQNEQKKGD